MQIRYKPTELTREDVKEFLKVHVDDGHYGKQRRSHIFDDVSRVLSSALATVDRRSLLDDPWTEAGPGQRDTGRSDEASRIRDKIGMQFMDDDGKTGPEKYRKLGDVLAKVAAGEENLTDDEKKLLKSGLRLLEGAAAAAAQIASSQYHSRDDRELASKVLHMLSNKDDGLLPALHKKEPGVALKKPTYMDRIIALAELPHYMGHRRPEPAAAAPTDRDEWRSGGSSDRFDPFADTPARGLRPEWDEPAIAGASSRAGRRSSASPAAMASLGETVAPSSRLDNLDLDDRPQTRGGGRYERDDDLDLGDRPQTRGGRYDRDDLDRGGRHDSASPAAIGNVDEALVEPRGGSARRRTSHAEREDGQVESGRRGWRVGVFAERIGGRNASHEEGPRDESPREEGQGPSSIITAGTFEDVNREVSARRQFAEGERIAEAEGKHAKQAARRDRHDIISTFGKGNGGRPR